ncbi:anaphase-promoting complex subunit 1 [Tetranychus urticae]|nr:anaphase-promoting complex subunit 1 [Tetranychus urticae]
MILGGSPQEFIPYGRKLLPYHPKQHYAAPSGKGDIGFSSVETAPSRDNFLSIDSVSLKDSSAVEKWILRGSDAGEEELYTCDNVVVHSVSDGESGCRLLRSFTLKSKVQQATWCCFYDETKDTTIECICAIDDKNLEIFSEEGDNYPITLPFQVSKLIPTKFGLLLERVPQSNETNSNSPYPSYPILYFLGHPFKDIGPVILKPVPTNNNSLTYLTMSNRLELVFFDKKTNLCLFYHKTEGTHSVWRLRKALESEIETITSNNCSRSSIDPMSRSSSFIDSPLVSSLRQSTGLFPSNISSPFRDISSRKLSSPIINQDRSSPCCSPHVLSPLRTSRLGASPASPMVHRGYSTPTTSKINQPSISTVKPEIASPLERISTPARSFLAMDFFDDIDTPILLEVCIEHIWSEPAHGLTGKTRKAFIAADLMGQNFMSYLLGPQQQLKLIRFDSSNDGKRIIFGPLNLISAKDAEPIESLNMICVLDPLNNIILYSGTNKVSAVHVPFLISPTSGLVTSPSSSKSFSMQQTVMRRGNLTSSSRPSSSLSHQPRFSAEDELSPVLHDQSSSTVFDPESSLTTFSYKSLATINAVKDNVKNRITIETNHSINFRLSLPPIATSSIVELCLKALKAVLPRDIGIQLVIKWYSLRNSPGTYEFTPEKELDLFKLCLLSLIGYDLDPNAFDMDFYSTISPSSAKKSKMESDERGSDEDWYWLLSNSPSSTKRTFIRRSAADICKPINPSNPLFPYLPSILFSLHLIHEELLLNILLKDYAPQLCDIIYMIASDLKLISYQDYYWRMAPNACSLLNCPPRITKKDFKSLVHPSFLTDSPSIVYNHLQSLLTNNVTNCFPYIPEVTLSIRRLVLIYSCFMVENLNESMVLSPVNHMRQDGRYVGLEVNFQGSAQERIIVCMNKLGMTQNDLKCIPPGLVLPLWSAIFHCKPDPPVTWNADCYTLIGREDLASLCGAKGPKYPLVVKEVLNIDNDEDGLCGLNREALSLLFPEDQRVDEAYEMLQSSKPVSITIQQRPGVSDNEFIEEQERHLYTLCIRTMALPIGRGMLTLRTFKPVVAKTFHIPKLCLGGRVPPRNTIIELAHIDIPSNMNVWPSFHNGVAAGLKVCPSASETIDSHWITYNKTKSNSLSNDNQNEHAGFLFALGLNGHLSKLSTMNIHDYLCKGNELTRVAVLLGLAAAKRGTMDISVERILSIHVEALLPSSSIELDVPPVVEVAAILGVGLLYQGSGQRHIAEMLLGEIGRPPGPEMEHYIDRESYALAAGLAFGLVTLGKGNEMISTVASSEGVSMADEMCNYMIGGHKRALTAAQKEKYKTPSYQIREGDYVNSDVTSPGATLALGMMFFDTNNEAVAKWVTAPDTQYLLESVRPDFLLLRTLAKGLIMWGSIKPTRAWIDSHLPKIVSDNALVKEVDYNSRIDYETMSQAYCNIIAGACMAVGLKYAGSANKEAYDSIFSLVNVFINLPNEQVLAEQAGRSTIESCLNVLIISLAMIMAGTGNVEIMRICRYLRSRISQVNVVLYGSHMASHMALGLLFLGGCRYTLSSSPESIAALICAFFPKYPIHSNDNRYHLQAFRHLYVLAAEPRLVLPRDIDTNRLVYAHLALKLKDKSVLRLKAPCFLPQMDLLEEVTLEDERYWKISFDRHLNWSNLITMLKRNGILFIKQKVGCLPYKEDPQGYKSIHAQCVMKDAVRGWTYKPDMLKSFSSNPLVINYTKYLLTPKSNMPGEALFQHHLSAVLFHCASNETVECLPSIMHFLKMINQSEKMTPFYLIQVRLLVHCLPKCDFIKMDFFEALKTLVENNMKGMDKASLISYLRGEKDLSEMDTQINSALIFYQLPPYASLAPLRGKISFTDVLLNIQHFNLSNTSLLMLSKIFSN